MGLLRRKRRQASPAQAIAQPVTRVLLTNALLGLGGYAIRQLVIRNLARRQASAGPEATGPEATGPEAGEAPGNEAATARSLPDRMATTVATAVATRSVPGALLVGSVIGVRALYRRGKARQIARGAAQPDHGPADAG